MDRNRHMATQTMYPRDNVHQVPTTLTARTAVA